MNESETENLDVLASPNEVIKFQLSPRMNINKPLQNKTEGSDRFLTELNDL